MKKYFVLWGLVFFCVSCGHGRDPLINPPSGFIFTNSSGDEIVRPSSDGLVQLRNGSGEKLLQFTYGAPINFNHVIAARTVEKSLLHFPSLTDKAGIVGTISFFVPCSPDQNALRICPGATTASAVASACSGELLLTTEAPSSGAYTWANTTRTGTDDCEVQVDIRDFNTGGSGTILLPYQFSFEGPEGHVYDAETDPQCQLLCDDPVVDFGGVERQYLADIDYGVHREAILPPLSDLAGSTISMQLTDSDPIPDPDFITRYFAEPPTSLWSFRADNTVTLDLTGYNFLLSGEQSPLVACEIQCEMFDDGEGSFHFDIDGSDQIRHTVTGYDDNNVSYLSPLNIDKMLAGISGGVRGTSVLVITDAGADEPFYFELGADNFAQVSGFEVLDLNNGAINVVTLDSTSLLAFSDTDQLKIRGDADDTVRLHAETWTELSGTVTEDDVEYVRYQKGAATVLVESGVTVLNNALNCGEESLGLPKCR